MTPRLIIVEGPDNCGKSTLAQAIALSLGGVYWRMTSGQGLSEHTAMALYQRNALDNAEINIKAGKVVVFDRHWPSDQVYGTVLRGQPSCDSLQMYSRCKQMHTIYINCIRDNAIEEHEQAKDPDHPYDSEVYEAIIKGYEDLFLDLEQSAPVVPYHLDLFIKQPTLLPAFYEGLHKIL